MFAHVSSLSAKAQPVHRSDSHFDTQSIRREKGRTPTSHARTSWERMG